jgi:hypothetical protein
MVTLGSHQPPRPYDLDPKPAHHCPADCRQCLRRWPKFPGRFRRLRLRQMADEGDPAQKRR